MTGQDGVRTGESVRRLREHTGGEEYARSVELAGMLPRAGVVERARSAIEEVRADLGRAGIAPVEGRR